MGILYPVPIAIYTACSLFFLLFSRRANGLKCVLVASYCGVVVITFTGGPMGAIWLAPLLLFLISLRVVFRPTSEAFGSRTVARLTFALFTMFAIGVMVGLVRYDPAIEFQKGGQFRTVLGLPLNYLMAAYRLHNVAFLVLAFIIPLRYYMDRKLFLECLVLCWFFSMVLGVLTILDFAGVGDFAFGVFAGEVGGGTHMQVLGFARAPHGKMLVIGIFMIFGMTQLTRSYFLKMLGYYSIPVLVMALLFSFSRSSMVALVVGLLSLVITLGGARAFKGIFISAIAVIVAAIALSYIPEVQERLSSLLPGGLAEASPVRVMGWVSLIKWLVASPGILAVGAGFQNFSYFVGFHAQVGLLGAGHNSWLHILTELGILGFLIFNVWLITIFSWLVSWRRMVTDKVDKMMPAIFISLMLGLVASCMFSETLVPIGVTTPMFTHFLLILSIWVSYYRTQMAEIDAMWESEYADYDYALAQEWELEPYNA